MNFHPISRSVAVSECGNYELRKSTLETRGDFYNAWHMPSGKHIGASHQKKEAVMACIAHRRAIVAKQGEAA